MVSGNLFHFRRNSWPPDEYISRITLQWLDSDSAAPPEEAWRRRLNSHANILKEFSVTFMEAMKMVRLGIRLWSYVREEASHGRKAPIDPFTRETCRPSASQGVPLGGMGSGSISRGFRGEFRQWQIVPGVREAAPVMANQFSVKLWPQIYVLLLKYASYIFGAISYLPVKRCFQKVLLIDYDGAWKVLFVLLRSACKMFMVRQGSSSLHQDLLGRNSYLPRKTKVGIGRAVCHGLVSITNAPCGNSCDIHSNTQLFSLLPWH